jgi:hypothetical protein
VDKNYNIKYELISMIQKLQKHDILMYEEIYIIVKPNNCIKKFTTLYKSLSICSTLNSDNITLKFINLNPENEFIKNFIISDIIIILNKLKIEYSIDDMFIIYTDNYENIKEILSKYKIINKENFD